MISGGLSIVTECSKCVSIERIGLKTEKNWWHHLLHDVVFVLSAYFEGSTGGFKYNSPLDWSYTASPIPYTNAPIGSAFSYGRINASIAFRWWVVVCRPNGALCNILTMVQLIFCLWATLSNSNSRGSKYLSFYPEFTCCSQNKFSKWHRWRWVKPLIYCYERYPLRSRPNFNSTKKQY